jgi:rhodanese-related sulfurtransferase
MFKKLFGTQTAPAVAQISVEQLQQTIQAQPGITLIDVRSTEEYRGDGHVAEAKIMPLPTLAQAIAKIPHETPIICICRSGNRSQAACDMLVQLGYTHVSNVRGGMIAWKNAKFPIRH